jgi:hypothetical protein
VGKLLYSQYREGGEPDVTTTEHQQQKQEADQLYERYAKPFEPAHWGEYIAVAKDGRTILGPTLREVAEKALITFGPGSFVFKVGEKAVGRWRWMSGAS